MISYNEAYEIVKTEISLLHTGVEEVELLNSVGRISAEDIYTDSDLPSFDNSSMDGICIKYSEGVNRWNVVGEISAGNFREVRVNENEAVLIMTGAKIPKGCDTVIPVEEIELTEEDAVLLSTSMVRKGQYIRKSGSDLKKSELIMQHGSEIKTSAIPLLAACGIDRLSVNKGIKAGIFASGDELIEIESTPGADKLRASNLYSLLTLGSEDKMHCINYGIVKDEIDSLTYTVGRAIDDNVDVIISTGGVSVGKFDFIEVALKNFDAEILFRKVNIKPGKPVLFAELNHRGRKILFFGLPGNPVSAFVNYHVFIRRAVREEYFKETSMPIMAVLLNDIEKTDNKRHFLRGVVNFNFSSGFYEVSTQKNQSSSNIAGLSSANALAVVDENCSELKTGERVKCIVI